MKNRYERQLTIPEVGEVGQSRLAQARVLVVGAGGLGSPVLLYLAAAGVGTLGVADSDRVDITNLNRQILYTSDSVGRSKVAAALQRIRALNPEVEVMPHQVRIRRENGLSLVKDYDLVVEACDSLETKSLISQLCAEARVPLVWAAVSRFEGQMGVYIPGHACRSCVFPETPEPGTYPSPAELGIMGAAAGVVGTLEAVEALKVLLGAGEVLVDRVLLWDGLQAVFDVVTFERNPECTVCG